MKFIKVLKKVGIYTIVVIASLLFVYGLSYLIDNGIEHRFTILTEQALNNKKAVRKDSINKKTYQSLKNLHHPQVEIAGPDQGSDNDIGFPAYIHGKYYNVDFVYKGSDWLKYYGPVKFNAIQLQKTKPFKHYDYLIG